MKKTFSGRDISKANASHCQLSDSYVGTFYNFMSVRFRNVYVYCALITRCTLDITILTCSMVT